MQGLVNKPCTEVSTTGVMDKLTRAIKTADNVITILTDTSNKLYGTGPSLPEPADDDSQGVYLRQLVDRLDYRLSVINEHSHNIASGL